jgi:hypothetical protein
MQHPTFERTNLIVTRVRSTEEFQKTSIKASLIGTWRHLNSKNRAQRQPPSLMMGIGMLALHFLDQHGLAHAAIAIEQHTRHARAARKLIAPLEFLERDPPASEFNPPRCLDKPNPSRRVVKRFFLNARREVGQVQGHREVVHVSPAEGTASWL